MTSRDEVKQFINQLEEKFPGVMLGYDALSGAARDEFEPKGWDICPECGSGHVAQLNRSYDCMECLSHWSIQAMGKIFELTQQKLSDIVEDKYRRKQALIKELVE